jgi:fibronectin-binding autotransporter adhesin
MKTRVSMLKILPVLCCAVASTAVFGQSTWIWTNDNPGDINVAANWTPSGGPPNSGNGDVIEFNGQSSGTVVVTDNTGAQSGNPGLGIWVTGSQVNPVFLCTAVTNALSAYDRFHDVQIDSGAGTFNLGNASTTNALQYVAAGSTYNAGFTNNFTNNSTSPAIIWPNVSFRAGGGNGHTFVFQGTGDWYVTNDLQMDNPGGGSGSRVAVNGPGTLIWSAGHSSYNYPSGPAGYPFGPFSINGGSVILQSPALIVDSACTTIQNYGTLLEWDLGAQSQTYQGVISGTGVLGVNSGTLTLGGGSTGGQNTYTGNIVLTGGELIANCVENFGTSGPLGVGGTITFSGGTLGFTSYDTYDYSPRFDNSAGQAYSFDTPVSVTFTNALTSVGGSLTKIGAGALTLGGTNTYSGPTTVSAGVLEITNGAGSGAITVAGSATLGVTEEGPQITPSALTVGSGGFLEFNNVSSTTTPPIAVSGTVSASSPITINVLSGSFQIGSAYPLIQFSGTPPAVVLNTLTGAGGNLSTNGNQIVLNITSLDFVWTGLGNAGWDTTSLNNWKVNGVSSKFQNNGVALFDDTAAGQTTVALDSTAVSPASSTVSSSAKIYSIASSGGYIAGTGGFTKSGSTTLTMSVGVNTYSGATTINLGGVLSVGTLAMSGVASDIGAASSSAANLVLDNGTLQYVGGNSATSDHLFELGAGGGTIDNEGGQLTLNNPGAIGLIGSGARTLTLEGDDLSGDTLAAVLGGATAITKSGPGEWILTGNSTNTGTVTINEGELMVGAGGSGAIGSGNIVDNGTLDFNIAGTLTNVLISGSGQVILDGPGTVVLPGNNIYSGGTTINNGTLQVGNGGPNGSLSTSGAIADNSLLIFNNTGTFSYTRPITGTGNVILRSGTTLAFGVNTYTGWTEIDQGAIFQPCSGDVGGLQSSVVTNNGTLLWPMQDVTYTVAGSIVGSGPLVIDAVTAADPGTLNLTGPCTYTGGTFIRECTLIIGDGDTNGWITGNVVFTNSAGGYEYNARVLEFERADNVTFPGNISGPGGTLVGGSVSSAGEVEQSGSGTLTLTGNNTYLGGTVINSGIVQVGNGGTSGSIGTGAVTDDGTLAFNLASNLEFTNSISGAGDVVQLGDGSLILDGTNAYSGATIVSNGTLVVTNVPGDMDVYGGILNPGGDPTINTLAIAGNLNMNAGTIVVYLNKSLSPSNTTVVITGAINITNGTLKLVNLGPAIVAGDVFNIFNPLPSIIALSGFTIVSPGLSISTNNLGTLGSITVTSVAAASSEVITATAQAGQFKLSWPAIWTGAELQVQIDPPGVGIGTNWVTIPGTGGTNTYSAPISTTGSVFYRLAP